MEKLIKISIDILDLEQTNMTPILSQHGITFSDKDLMMDIAKNNSGLYNLFCYYSEQDDLKGYFRYNYDNDKNIIIRSIQLQQPKTSPNVLRQLLYIAYRQLENNILPDTTKIYAWVNTSNQKSFDLLKKLGFKYETGHKDASKFSTTKTDLLKIFKKFNIDKMFTQQSHLGQYPIRVLRHNLPHTIVTHRPEKRQFLENKISEGKINPQIICKISNEFGLIKVDADSNQIEIHEQFLAFLWSFIYSTFVIVEEGVQTKILLSGSNLWDGKIDNSRPIVIRAQELYIWSKDLPKVFSNYPMNLPNPEIFYSAEEQFYINKVNGIYLKAVTYLVNHEIAHLVNNHIDTLRPLNVKLKNHIQLSEDEKTTYKTIEGEADQYAREAMIEQDDDEKIKLINGLSIILAHCASLFAIKHPSSLTENVHPDIDNRLFHSINFLNLQEQKNIDYIYLVGAISLNLFFAFNKVELDKIGFTLQVPKEMEDPKDYFSECLRIVDNIKSEYEKLQN